ncbi:hypothetical protein [Mechercharimyces sp. CAU 1602]|uniref:hypothetical protein n=1 Tax=Mechercharimyces sp. CAU 1602 TaxID=2973933 RepID=UPI002163BDF9|nr:hypothetical protein [Mechercharimyces sp. CAU 1602]MCS1351312.1 hypothetical protein [Mechercharimyces sp. CAU 1602]
MFKRYRMFWVLIGVLIVTSIISFTVQWDPVFRPKTEPTNPKTSVSIDSLTLSPEEGQALMVESVHMVTRTGGEVPLDGAAYISLIEELLVSEDQRSVEQTDLSSDYPYILIVRLKDEEPLLFRVGQSGVIYEHTLFMGEPARSLYQNLREVAARSFLDVLQAQSLTMEVRAEDIGEKKELSKGESKRLLERLQTAIVKEETKNVDQPSFPRFQIHLSSGNPVAEERIEVLDKTTIRFHYGAERMDYKVDAKLVTTLEEWLPTPSFNADDVRTLFTFQWVAKQRTDKEREAVKLGSTKEKDRLLRVLRKVEECRSNSSAQVSGQSPQITLYFQLAEQERPLHIFRDAFQYAGKSYQCSGLYREYASLD